MGLGTVTKINFLRAYLADLSSIRLNIMSAAGEETPVIPQLDKEIASAMRALVVLRQALVPDQQPTAEHKPVKPPRYVN